MADNQPDDQPIEQPQAEGDAVCLFCGHMHLPTGCSEPGCDCDAEQTKAE